jgi:hypothetical protein
MSTLKSYWRFVSVATLSILATAAYADSTVDEVWTCTLNEGHTVEEMVAAQAAWVAWANKQPHGAKIRGSVAAPMVSANLGIVLYIDSYPDLATLAADNDAYDSPEGEKLQARFDEITTCTAAALYTVQDAKM